MNQPIARALTRPIAPDVPMLAMPLIRVVSTSGAITILDEAQENLIGDDGKNVGNALGILGRQCPARTSRRPRCRRSARRQSIW